MKIRSLLLMGIYCLLAPAVVRAQLQFSLGKTTLKGAPGGTVTFSGALTNTGPNTLFLNSDSALITGPGLMIDDTKFFQNTQASLASGAGTGLVQLFDVNISPLTPRGSYTGSFTILGGAGSSAKSVLASSGFKVDVVPETGTFLGLVSMLCVGGIATIRRRQAR